MFIDCLSLCLLTSGSESFNEGNENVADPTEVVAILSQSFGSEVKEEKSNNSDDNDSSCNDMDSNCNEEYGSKSDSDNNREDDNDFNLLYNDRCTDDEDHSDRDLESDEIGEEDRTELRSDDIEQDNLKRKFNDWTLSQTQTQVKKRRKMIIKTYGKSKDKEQLFRKYEKLSENSKPSSYLLHFDDEFLFKDNHVENDGDLENDDHDSDEDVQLQPGNKKYAVKRKKEETFKANTNSSETKNAKRKNTRLRTKNNALSDAVLNLNEVEEVQERKQMRCKSAASSKGSTHDI